MKNNKIKKYTLRFGIVFLIVLAILTYFSSTIDTLLLPRVKVYEIEEGSLSEDKNNTASRYITPVSTIATEGDFGTIYVVNYDNENGDITVEAIDVEIKDKDDYYYEVEPVVKVDISGEMAVYSTSKSISDGDRVYVEE